MTRFLWTLALLVGTATLAPGEPVTAIPLARTEATPALAKLGVEDDGKTVEIAQGGKIVVHLPGEASGTLRWSRVPAPLGPLTVLENRVDRTSRNGKVVTETYVFGYRAAAAGTHALQFAATGGAAGKTVQFTVKVLPSALAERLTDLTAASAHLALGISFVGADEPTFTEIYLATPNAQFKGDKKIIRLSPGEVRRVIDALVETGCVNQAVRHDMPLTKPIPTNKPTCVLTILGNDKYSLHLELGWCLDVLTRVDALCGALDAKGRTQLKAALAPLEARRAEWQAQTPQSPPTTQATTRPH